MILNAVVWLWKGQYWLKFENYHPSLALKIQSLKYLKLRMLVTRSSTMDSLLFRHKIKQSMAFIRHVNVLLKITKY